MRYGICQIIVSSDRNIINTLLQCRKIHRKVSRVSSGIQSGCDIRPVLSDASRLPRRSCYFILHIVQKRTVVGEIYIIKCPGRIPPGRIPCLVIGNCRSLGIFFYIEHVVLLFRISGVIVNPDRDIIRTFGQSGEIHSPVCRIRPGIYSRGNIRPGFNSRTGKAGSGIYGILRVREL